MTFVELEDGSWINPDLIETMFKTDMSAELWLAGMNHGESTYITDDDRAHILKTAGFVKIKKEKNNEQ